MIFKWFFEIRHLRRRTSLHLLFACSLLALFAAIATAATASVPSEEDKAARSDEGTPSLTISPTIINFGRVTIAHTSPHQTVTLTNNGNAKLDFYFIGIEGDNRSEFAFYSSTCGPMPSLQPGASCALRVAFSPDDYGQVGVEIYIIDNAANSPQTVLMYGFGIH